MLSTHFILALIAGVVLFVVVLTLVLVYGGKKKTFNVPPPPPVSTSGQQRSAPPSDPVVLTGSFLAGLTLINAQRAKHGVNPLKYNSVLQQVAGAYAKVLFEKIDGVLSGTSEPHSNGALSGNYGENVSCGVGIVDDVFLTSLNHFYDEVASYDFSKPGFTPQTGHFTATVWASTTDVGFGMVMDPATGKWACVVNFSPTGNLLAPPPDTGALFRTNVLP